MSVSRSQQREHSESCSQPKRHAEQQPGSRRLVPDESTPIGDEPTAPSGAEPATPRGGESKTPSGDESTTPSGDVSKTPSGDESTAPRGDETPTPTCGESTTPSGNKPTSAANRRPRASTLLSICFLQSYCAPIMGECRKLDTEPLGSLGTLRVVGSVVVCVVVHMRVQHSQRHRQTRETRVSRIAARIQHKRNGRK